VIRLTNRVDVVYDTAIMHLMVWGCF